MWFICYLVICMLIILVCSWFHLFFAAILRVAAVISGINIPLYSANSTSHVSPPPATSLEEEIPAEGWSDGGCPIKPIGSS